MKKYISCTFYSIVFFLIVVGCSQNDHMAYPKITIEEDAPILPVEPIVTPVNYCPVKSITPKTFLTNDFFVKDFKYKERIQLESNYANSIESEDMNGDGHKDVVIAETNQNKIMIKYNNGSGDFTSELKLDTWGRPQSLKLVDTNNDGDIDILTGTDNGRLHFFENNGDGTFTRNGIRLENYSQNIEFLDVADIDCDGFVDVAIPGYVSGDTTLGGLYWVSNNGEGKFWSYKQTKVSSGGYFGVTLKDLDNDAKPDLVGTNLSNRNVEIYKNNSGTFSSLTTSIVGAVDILSTRPEDVESDDFDGDGINDLVWGTECTLDKNDCFSTYNHTIKIAYGNGDNTFQPTKYIPLKKSFGESRKIQIIDFNNDGALDIATVDDINTNPFSGQGDWTRMAFLLNNRAGDFIVQEKEFQEFIDGTERILDNHTYSNTFILEDFNSDGILDLILDNKLNNPSISNTITYYLGQNTNMSEGTHCPTETNTFAVLTAGSGVVTIPKEKSCFRTLLSGAGGGSGSNPGASSLGGSGGTKEKVFINNKDLNISMYTGEGGVLGGISSGGTGGFGYGSGGSSLIGSDPTENVGGGGGASTKITFDQGSSGSPDWILYTAPGGGGAGGAGPIGHGGGSGSGVYADGVNSVDQNGAVGLSEGGSGGNGSTSGALPQNGFDGGNGEGSLGGVNSDGQDGYGYIYY